MLATTRNFFRIIQNVTEGAQGLKKIESRYGFSNAIPLQPSWIAHRGRKILRDLGIPLIIHGRENIVRKGPLLIAANHLSLLDLFAIQNIWTPRFITSRDVQSSPIIGTITTRAGCLFTDRKNPSLKVHETAEVVEALRRGDKVVLFPEGTSSDGRQVLPFKGRFFQTAVDTQTLVQPVAIQYLSRAVDPEHFCYYGKRNLLTHLLRLADPMDLSLVLTVFSARYYGDRREAAEDSHRLISSVTDQNSPLNRNS